MKDEKILIDTSIWIDYFKKQNAAVVEVMDLILAKNDIYVPKVVIAELIQGSKSEREVLVIEEFLDAFYIIDNAGSTWIKAGKLSFTMKQNGKTVNLIDCYISIMAMENNCAIYTLDKHFSEIKNFIKIKLLKA
ncbi:MAG: PIN domain-containing protein [Candidatus Acidulodesulfobacterium ferriphilum]|jgi:predicted nucleic acid-binding protein|uniref:PIN domain-containing protein n=1 Tax=Candidatus Acidulodesulfobacterium ferriphilum TaxID=2597223 RepID=A0A519BBY6_9DELT|nr:MAG: PIN domain-containing protein [Candidatus Acidulodesulfobacterium ferriphilum]